MKAKPTDYESQLRILSPSGLKQTLKWYCPEIREGMEATMHKVDMDLAKDGEGDTPSDSAQKHYWSKRLKVPDLLIYLESTKNELDYRETAESGTAQELAQLPETNDDVRFILGRPNFWCAPYAMSLRLLGHEIERKAEAEQAAVLHWLMNHYLRSPENWRQNAAAEMSDAKSVLAPAS